jgi:anti-sigma B factor antagonist
MGVYEIINEDQVVFRASGEIDLSNAEMFSMALAEALSHGQETIVDFSAVTFLDSTGLGALVKVYRLAEAEKKKLYVIGAQRRVARIMELTGLGRLLARPENLPAADLEITQP